LKNKIKPRRSYSVVNNKVYELRTYSILPQYYLPFLELTNKYIHLRLNISPVLGYWTVEMGGLNQVTHIWEYDNLHARAEVRAKLANEKDWNEIYMKSMRTMLDKQTNSLMIPKTPIQKPSKPGVYELVTINRKYGRNINWNSHWKKAVIPPETTLVGQWTTNIGDLFQDVQLWHYDHFNNFFKVPPHVKLSKENEKKSIFSYYKIISSH